MAIYELPSETGINFTEGAHQIFVYVSQQVPMFIPAVLFSFFMIILITGFFLQEKRLGKGEFSMWFAIAGYMTSIVALLMLIIDGLIPVYVVTITISFTFIGTIWFFLTPNRD